MTAMQGAGAARPPLAWLALLSREPRLMQRGVVPRSIELTRSVPGRLAWERVRNPVPLPVTLPVTLEDLARRVT